MTEIQSSKRYDLEDRTFNFARCAMAYTNNLPKTASNVEIGRQFIRSSGSIGANYIEANEYLSKRDFLMRIKICRKEAKESRYWLRLSEPNEDQQANREKLINEVTELMKIFGAIVEKTRVV